MTVTGNLPLAQRLLLTASFPYSLNLMKVSPVKLALFALVYFVLMMGLWVLYTSTLKLWELLIGAAAAVVATIATAVVEQQRFAQFSPAPKWLLYFLTLPWFVLRDTALVYRAAIKYALRQKSDGYLVAVDFDSGGEDARSSARRALVTALTTIPPNSVVVGIDRTKNKLLLHMLAPDDIPWFVTHMGGRA